MSIHYRKTGKKKWEVKYRNHSHKQQSKSFMTKKEAEIFERKVLTELSQNIWSNPSEANISLEEIWNQWLVSKTELKVKTRTDYESLWNIHIKPTLAKVSLKTLTTRVIQQWISSTISDGLSPYRRNKALVLLSTVLDFAVDMSLIPRNPTRGSSGKIINASNRRSLNKRPTTALTANELINLAEHCGEYKPLVLTLGLCGLRWAEAIGLQVRDVDLKSNLLTIQRSLSEVNGIFHQTTTKTANTRVLPIPDLLSGYLQGWCNEKNPQDLVFTNSSGNPISISNFRNRIYKPAIKMAKVPSVTIHDLRHTTASIAISMGASVMGVRTMLGHASTKMTLDTYTHLFPEDLRLVSNSINQAITNADVRRKFAEKENTDKKPIEINKVRITTRANVSGPCRDRTDDPQIKSLWEEGESTTE